MLFLEMSVKCIADDVMAGAIEALNVDTDLNSKANTIAEILTNGILLTTEQAVKNTDENYYVSANFQKMQSEHIEEIRTIWARQMYLFLEKKYGKIKQGEFLDGLKKILCGEISNWYKKAQYQIIKERNLCMDFVCHDSACAICKCMEQNEYIEEKLLFGDTCDSYFVKPVNMMEVDNLISGTVKFYDVPKKYKKSVASFYKLTKIKFEKFMKNPIKIKFVAEFDYGDEYKDITDMINFVYDFGKNQFEIKFDDRTYQHDILKALFHDVKPTEKMVELYYAKTSKDVIFPKGNFITYLAGQNEYEYMKESLIAYVLTPWKLKVVDNEMFQLIQSEVEKR